MDVEIRRLSPDLADDYVHFFDVTSHDQYVDAHKCYCVCWCADDYEGKDFSTAEKRRTAAKRYVEQGIIQGYLAYYDEKPVGWCNANTKSECLKCYSWRMFMKDVPVQDIADGIKVKSVFCFVITPEMQRAGIATQLLNRVIADAKTDGFDCIEAYPNQSFESISADFMGPVQMYKRLGFTITGQTKQKYIMQKQL